MRRKHCLSEVVARGHYFDIADQQTQKVVEFLSVTTGSY